MEYYKKGKSWIDWLAFGWLITMVIFAYTSANAFLILIDRGSKIAAVTLLLLFFNHINWLEALKARDRELLVVLIAGGISVVNMFIARAGVGVLFDIANLLLIVYLVDKIQLDERIYYMLAGGLLLIVIFQMKLDSGGYNPNTISLIVYEVVTMSALGLSVYTDKCKKNWLVYLYLLVFFAFLVIPVAKKYRGRTAYYAAIIFTLLFLLVPKVVWGIRKLYYAIMAASAAVSFFVPVIVSYYYDKYGYRPFNGREIAWIQFMTAWIKEPITGIGNDYVSKIPNMAFGNVHNGLIHLLSVYGVVLFIYVIILFARKMSAIETDHLNITKKMALSLLVAMFAISAMETYMVQAFSNIWLFWILLILFKKDDIG